MTDVKIHRMIGSTTHTFSHVRWRMQAYLCTGNIAPAAPNEATCWAGAKEFKQLTLPKAVQRIIDLVKAAGFL